MKNHLAEPDDLKEALAAAVQMREENTDTHHVAKWLRRYHRRCQALEQLLLVTDRYLRFGMPEHELSEMRVLVSHLRETAADEPEVNDPLPI